MTWVRLRWAPTDDRRSADALVRQVVSSSRVQPVGVADDWVVGRLCPLCGSHRHGRPFVRGAVAVQPSVSISRTSGVTLVAASGCGSIGVDVECVDGFSESSREGSVADVLLHPAERATTPEELATTWVRKEALLKAQGLGLAVDPRTVRLGAPGDAAVVLDWPGQGAWWLRDVALGPGLRAAVAGRGEAPAELSVTEAGPAEPPGPARGRTDLPGPDR